MTYIEQARVRFLIDILAVDVIQSLPIILASLKVDFRAPILFGQEIEIGTRVDWIGKTSFSVSHEMHAGSRTSLRPASWRRQAPCRPTTTPPSARSRSPTWRTAFTAHEGHSLERPASDEQTFDLLSSSAAG